MNIQSQSAQPRPQQMAVERQETTTRSEHDCGRRCECFLAPCEVCFGLDWRLLCRRDTNEEARKRVRFKTTLVMVRRSAAGGEGCDVCWKLQELMEAMLKSDKDCDEVVVYGFNTIYAAPFYRGKRNLIGLKLLEDWTTIDLLTYVEDKKPPRNHPGRCKAIPTDLCLEELIMIVKGWLNSCMDNHHFCLQLATTPLPTRVLDVAISGLELIRLIDSKGLTGDYVALSHCWGTKGDMLTTTTDNLKARMSGTRLSHFPQTFQDAISITQRLGIRYLWIDSLCIIQDSLSDWEAESVRMGDIYTNSFLTIAATHSTNSQGGLFPARASTHRGSYLRDNTQLIGPVEVRLNNVIQYGGHITPSSLSDGHSLFGDLEKIETGQGNTNLDTSPLLTRAWAFQERLLSTRTLHVHAEELFWECKSRNMCECTALDTQSHPQQSELEILPGSQGFKGRYAEICAGIQSVQQMADYWLRLVVAYSSLTLTYESDRLQALSGLATRLSKHFRSECLAGLWAFDLPRSLIWRRIKTEIKDLRKAYVRVNLVRETGGGSEILSDDKLSVTFGTPSWSWAAVQPQDGYAISYRHHTLIISRCRYKNDPRIEVLSVKCPSAGETPFGSVRSGKLSIKGALIPTKCKLRGDDGTPLKEPLLFAEGTEEGSKVLFDNDETTDMEGRILWSLVIGSVEDLWPSKSKMQRFDQALVLQKSSREPNAFERVGLVTVDTDKGWFHGASVESIIIV